MAVNRTVVDAAPDAVAAVLADPRTYADFVVGSKRIRRFDPAWPETGAVIHHTLGLGPFILRDLTRVVDAGDGRRFELRAQMRPFAVNRVSFTIRAAPSGTEVEVEERAVEGPAALMWNPAFDGLMWLRNQEMLRRLKKLVEQRQVRRSKITRR
jgi:hypothetical protein